MKSIAVPLVALFALGSAGDAFAQSDADRATARALFFQGSEALDRRSYAAAADAFGRSDALVHAPTASLGFARAQAGMGRLVAAYETYNRIVREGVAPSAPAAFRRAFEDARREAIALEARLPTIVIAVTGHASPTVSIDGAPVPSASIGVKRFIDPGSHEVVATAEGFLPAKTTFTVEEGKGATAELVLQRDPKFPPIGGAVDATPPVVPPPPRASAAPAPPLPIDAPAPASTRRTIGFVVGGVGLAGLGAAAITGAMFLGRKSQIADHCSTGTGGVRFCDTDGLAAVDSARTLGTTSTIAWIGGAVAVAGGLALVLSAPASRAASRVGLVPILGPNVGGASFRRSF